jgi:Fur family zinc uptake transcriptional regulator
MPSNQAILEKASQQCQQRGERLTPKRSRILELLLAADGPKSAYDLISDHDRVYGESPAAMSVYRMLNFLVETGLAHRLATTNQFMACAHIACDHAHRIPLLLICDQCHDVEEVGLGSDLMAQLQQTADASGFRIGSTPLEIHGTCQRCNTPNLN